MSLEKAISELTKVVSELKESVDEAKELLKSMEAGRPDSEGESVAKGEEVSTDEESGPPSEAANDEVSTLTKDEVFTALVAFKRTYGQTARSEVLQKLGVKRFPELSEDQYPKVLEAIDQYEAAS